MSGVRCRVSGFTRRESGTPGAVPDGQSSPRSTVYRLSPTDVFRGPASGVRRQEKGNNYGHGDDLRMGGMSEIDDPGNMLKTKGEGRTLFPNDPENILKTKQLTKKRGGS